MKKTASVFLIAGVLVAGSTFFLFTPRSQGQQRFAEEPLLILYSQEDFQGHGVEITGSVPDLPIDVDARANEFDWNDQVRSIIVVRGTWRLYQHGRCNTVLDDTPTELLNVRAKASRAGWSTLVSATSRGALELPNAAAGGFYRDISSVELVSEQNLPDWAAPTR